MTRVVVTAARQREVPVTVSLVGTVRPVTRSTLGAEVAGLVTTMPVDEGDLVEKGAVICKLRDTTVRLALAEAVATRDQLRARLAELEAGTRPENLKRAEAEWQEAKALLEKWKHERDRVMRLREEGIATDKEYFDTVGDYAAAAQRAAQMKWAYDLAVAGPRKETIAEARHAVAARQAAVTRLEDELDKTTIRAPFKGYITQQHTEVGEWLTLGGSVVEMLDIEHVLVRIDVPESAIPYVHIGDSARVRIEALGCALTGTIKHIIPQADESARTFPVEIELPNKAHRLKAGMFARATVNAGPRTESVVVPKDALLQRGGVDMVVVVAETPRGTMAQPVPIQVGAEDGLWVAARGPGLVAGTMLAIRGQERVYFPSPVEIAGVIHDLSPPATQAASAGH